MTITETDVVQQLNKLSLIYQTAGALYKLNAPIQMMEAVSRMGEECKQTAKDMAVSYCQALDKNHVPIKRMFKDDAGKVSVKVDLVRDVDEPRFLKTMIDSKDEEGKYLYRDQFMARASDLCKVIMKQWNANPIEGVELSDYLQAGYFRGTSSTTPKMYVTIDKALEWALDGVGLSEMMPRTDELDERMAVLDSIKRACREYEVLKH